MATSVQLVLFTFFAIWLTGVDGSCHGCDDIQNVPPGFHSVSYTQSDEHLENPGRGFYRMLEAKSSNFIALTVYDLDSIRKRTGINVGLRVYILDTFVDSPISSSFLQHIRSDMQIVRDAGWTMALRFHYTNTRRSHAPYGDATKSVMLQHIEQLGPIWHEFEGLISVIQAGFIGTYGEWYYTTHFGDPDHRPMTDSNWQDRNDILMAIVHHSPSTIPVQVRIPSYKVRACGTTRAATLADAHHNTCIGRIGHHNDCFLASDTDVGTYRDPATEKPYLAEDTRYLPISGETCRRSVDSNGHRTHRSDCPTALKELAEFHWSILHDDYHPDVLSDWKNQGCFNEIHKRLGYRLSLKKAILPLTVPAGGEVCYHIVMENTGYAAPFKPWTVALVFKPQSGGEYFAADLRNVDVKSWLPGVEHTLTGAVKLSSQIHSGTYDVYLAIYDSKMKNYADYYILLANVGVPVHSAGLNSLKTTIQVSPVHTSSNICPSVDTWTPPSQERYSRVFGSDGKGGTSKNSSCTEITVPDGSFESNEKSDWKPYRNGYTFMTSDAQNGHNSIKVTNGGAKHYFRFSPPKTKFILTAYSKMVGSAHRKAADYSIYCDIEKPDGSHVWGQYEPFQQGNSNWHKATLRVHISEGIAVARCYLLFRRFASGTAYFDNVKMWTVPDAVDPATCKV